MREPTKHIHWSVQGYDRMTKEGQLFEVVQINVVADNSNEALKTAKTLIKKNKYRIASINDACPFEDYNKDLQLEIQKRTYKLIKKIL